MRNTKFAVMSCLVALSLSMGVATALAEEFEWSMDADCAMCHTDKVLVQADEASEESAEGEAVAAETADDADDEATADEGTADETTASFLYEVHGVLPCTSCHVKEDIMAKKHKGETPESKLPKKLSSKDKVETETCLACHGSWEDLAEKTADCDVLTDTNGLVVNPHDLVEGHEDKLTCTSCHSVHEEDAEIAKDAALACKSCHHSGVWECGTCHA